MKWGVRKQRRLQSNVRAARQSYKKAGYGEKTAARVELSSAERKLKKHNVKMTYKNDPVYKKERNKAIARNMLGVIGTKAVTNAAISYQIGRGKEGSAKALAVIGSAAMYYRGVQMGNDILDARRASLKRNNVKNATIGRR